ncbi:uncharacterized protein LOC142221522 isoform X3 [Haematobia irritans]|uniref:uncharacterized protein LOC142221522 isoform X3 n=1 Tax=Haematobia irritans TaxID=7368 RepID=UPI003F50A2F0
MEYIEWQQSHFADHHLNGPIEVNLQTPSNIQSISKAMMKSTILTITIIHLMYMDTITHSIW